MIPQNELRNQPHFYLPVHGVFKDSSSTTKCRAVFDASAVTTSGASLNDTLLTGPNLYPPLTDVLIKFRCHCKSKMFREILLNPECCDLHRFLMRDNHGVIRDCRMERLTFGVNCSPFIATQVLHHLAHLHATSHPTASAAIMSAFYVDDFLSGAGGVDEAHHLRKELCDLLAQAGMLLRKWRSNSPEVRALIPDHLLETSPTLLPLTQLEQTPLGIHWDVNSDTLHVAIPSPPDLTKVTKRTIASSTAAVFDVLGLFSPAIIQARIILQETWKRNLPWDVPVPQTYWSSGLHGPKIFLPFYPTPFLADSPPLPDRPSTTHFMASVMPLLWPMELPCTSDRCMMMAPPPSPWSRLRFALPQSNLSPSPRLNFLAPTSLPRCSTTR